MTLIIALAAVAALALLFRGDGANRAEEMYRGVRGYYKFRRDKRELAKQLRGWVADTDPERAAELELGMPEATAGLATWLGGLPDKELEEFTQRVARFCASLNFDIAWLNDPNVQREESLRRAVEDAVLLYSVAAWRAQSVQGEVRAFLNYRAWVAQPKRHRKFGDELYRALVQKGLATVPAELYLAPDEERIAFATTAIKNAAESHHAEFNKVLRHLDEKRRTASAPLASAAHAAPSSNGVATAEKPSLQS